MRDTIFPFSSTFSFYRISLLKKDKRTLPRIPYLRQKSDFYAFSKVLLSLRKLNVLERLGDLQKHIVVSKTGLDFAKRVHDVNLLSCFLRNLGVANWGLGNYEEALVLFNELMKIAEDVKSKHLLLIASGNIGLVQYWLGNNQIAMKNFSKALDLAKALKDERNVSIAYESIGNTHKEMGNHREALRYLDKALKIAKKQGNRRGEGILYGSKGDLYYDQREYKLAFEYFHKALRIATDAQDRWSECIWRANIGALHILLGEEQKGISFAEDSLEIARKLRLFRSEKINLRELATARMRIGELDVAEKLARQGFELSERTKDRQNQVWFKTIIGIIAVKRGDLKNAICLLENAVKRADPAGDKWQLYRARLFLMRARFLKGKSRSVLNEMKEMFDPLQGDSERGGEIESLKAEEVAAEAYIILGKCLREVGRRRAASEYTKKAQALIEKHKLYSLKREFKKSIK